MTTRTIVRDPSMAGGRWHFAGTAIFVDAVRTDCARDSHGCRVAYHALGLSDEEISAALDFVFPAIDEPRFDTSLIVGLVHCSCGITRKPTIDHDTMVTDPCTCGRVWHIVTNLESPPIGAP